MAEPFTCYCGVRTRSPFKVNGELMCVICADKIAPRLVSQRAVQNWQEFIQSNRVGPTRPSYRARWSDIDED